MATNLRRSKRLGNQPDSAQSLPKPDNATSASIAVVTPAPAASVIKFSFFIFFQRSKKGEFWFQIRQLLQLFPEDELNRLLPSRQSEGSWAPRRDMLLAKLNGQPYESEIPLQTAEQVPAPPPVVELSGITVALVIDDSKTT